MNILHLNLKTEYFNEIKEGNKPFEFRECKDHWRNKLINRDYDEVHFKLGYPKNDDTEKIIKRKYISYELKVINHPHFNDSKPTKVFAILTNGEER